MTPGKGWMDWLLSEERRQARRRKSLPLVAYYWDGANPVAHQVRDASAAGLYLVTQHRWYPGTVLAMTLQHTGMEAEDPERAIAVNAKVVRTGDDGVGFEFIMPEKGADLRNLPGMIAPMIDKKRLKSFINRATETKGQALIEFALGLPLIFLLILNVVNFGGFFYAWITTADSARSGANYAALGGVSAGDPVTPTLTQLTTMAKADLSSLPNSGSATVNACESVAGAAATKFQTTPTVTCPFTMSATDPDGLSIIEVQVTYTYTPFFSAFSFPRLGVHLTIPPTTITQSAIMRSIQ